MWMTGDRGVQTNNIIPIPTSTQHGNSNNITQHMQKASGFCMWRYSQGQCMISCLYCWPLFSLSWPKKKKIDYYSIFWSLLKHNVEYKAIIMLARFKKKKIGYNVSNCNCKSENALIIPFGQGRKSSFLTNVKVNSLHKHHLWNHA